MITFAEFLEGLFDTRTHQHPMDLVADEFIDTLPRQFLDIDKNLLRSYVRCVLENDKEKFNDLRIKLFVAAKSIKLVKFLDNILSKKKKEMEKDISWFGNPEHQGKALGQ